MADSGTFPVPVYSIWGQAGQNTVYPVQMVPGAPVAPDYILSGGPHPVGFATLQAPIMMQTTAGAPAPPGYTPPQAPVMMPVPDRPPGCPPGLEYLTQIDQLLVHQKVSMMEAVLRVEMRNAYIVKNSVGQQVFTAEEENDFFTLQFCGPNRPFTIHIQDNLGQEVLTLTRPLRCSLCCFPCCLQELEVQNPPGNPIGYVVQDWHPFLPKFTVLNEMRQPQLKVKGPFCDCNCMSDVTFEVKSLDESAVVGQITKQWGGFLHEGFTDADNFGISFPMDLDVKMKAVMLGVCFLIDFMFFETNPQNSHHS